jgi:hypothetical protein
MRYGDRDDDTLHHILRPKLHHLLVGLFVSTLECSIRYHPSLSVNSHKCDRLYLLLSGSSCAFIF